MQQKESGIYLITCRSTSKRYIGSSKDVWYRWRSHKKDLKRQCHKNRYLQRAWNKYGADAFDCVIIENVPDESQLLLREQHWLDLLKPEYNLAPKADKPIGMGGKRQSEASKRKSSESNKAQWASMTEEDKRERVAKTVHPNSEHTRKRVSEGLKKAWAEGRIKRPPPTEETKAKISNTLKKHFEPVKVQTAAKRAEWEKGREQRKQERLEKLRLSNIGRTPSEETKEKLRQAATLQMNDPEFKELHRELTKAAMQRPEVKDAMKGRKKANMTPEVIAKITAKTRGQKRSPETIELQRQKRRDWWAKKKAEKQAE